MSLYIIAPLIIAAVVGVILLGLYMEKKRREAMIKVAEQLGLEYWGDTSASYNLKLFKIGDSQRATHCIKGTKDGIAFELFDYRYSTGSGKNRRTHHFSVCVLTVAQYYKNLYIRSENLFDKIAGVIGFDDIDFESKEFSSRFYVQSNDKKFAYDVINPQMMEYLLARPKCPTIEISGKQIGFHYQGTISPEKYIELFNLARQFCQKIPNYVLEEYSSKTKGYY